MKRHASICVPELSTIREAKVIKGRAGTPYTVKSALAEIALLASVLSFADQTAP